MIFRLIGTAGRVESRPTNHESRLFRGAVACTALCAALSAGAADFTFGALGDTPYTWFEEAHSPDLLEGMSREISGGGRARWITAFGTPASCATCSP